MCYIFFPCEIDIKNLLLAAEQENNLRGNGGFILIYCLRLVTLVI